MPKLEEDLIDRLTPHPEVREKARALLRTLRSKTGPGTGYDIGDAKSGLPAICAYLASKSAGYADVTQDVAQKASCLAPKTFTGTLKTVKAALLPPSNKTPNGTPSKSGGVIDPTAYATLISEHDIGQPRRVEKWMNEAQAALLALPRFREDYASRLTESSAEVRIVVFCWVCQTIRLVQFPTAQHIPLADKHDVPVKVFKRLLRMMEDDCEDLKESIHATIRKLREKLAKVEAPGAAAASTSKTPTSTPSQSRSASPTKSAMRGTNLTPSSSLTNSAKKRKVAFSLSDVVSASEDDEGIFALPETPSKKKRPRRAAAARVMPMSKAVLASATSSSSEDERAAAAAEDIEMSDAAIPTPTTPRARPRPPATASTSGTPPVAGPSTPRRPVATPTHAYRTPPSARIQLRLSDDEDEPATVGDDAEDAEASEDDDDDTLPPSRRFRPVFLDRVQWAQRAPRLAHDRAAAEQQAKKLVGRWGCPFELLRRASAKPPAG